MARSTSSASSCRRIPLNPVTLERAIEDEPRLQAERDSDPVVERAFEIAQKLEGLHRHASTHAAGIVIGERALTEMVPLYRDPKSMMPVTQFNMKWVEQAGLVKFDFLGLKTLTVLDTAVALLRKRDVEIDLAAIPLDDEKTYAMLARAEAVGIFQLESQGMRRALLDMRPDRFEDIIALVALYRPGPMANIPTYCARKHRLEEPDYIHPKLEPILRETFGVIVYQEQVMQAAQILAGYSLGEADLLRRAMGKKIRSEMQKQRSRFVDGCIARDIDRAQAEAIFELLERFADYGFNKSHAAAYALVAYQTAYMKANYPVEFLAASMTLDMGNTDKLSEFRAEAERLGIKVEPPSINRSGVAFAVAGNTIYYALAALKGVGRQAVEAMVEARGDKPFADISDFAGRVNPRAVNKRVLESLAAAGAFDVLEGNRARVFAAVDVMLASAQREHEAAESGALQFSFGGPSAKDPIRLPQIEAWLPAERLQKEFDAIGFFLTGHPLDDYAATLKRMRVQSWAEFARAVRTGVGIGAGRVAGTVVARTERRTRTGSKMGIIGLSDPTGHYEAVLFSEGLAQFRDLLEPGRSRIADALCRAARRRRARAHRHGRAARSGGGQALQGAARLSARRGADRKRGQAARRPGLGPLAAGQGRWRGRADIVAGRGHRGRGEASRPLQGLPADRRRHQGGTGRGGGRGGVIRSASALLSSRRSGQRSLPRREENMKIIVAWLVAASALIAGPALAQTAGTAPQFQVDPFWPKPLPNNWILGQVSGIATDKYDRLWVVHRRGSLTPRERAAEQNPPEAKCCAAAPPVLVFDQSGNLIRHWGGPGQGYEWPENEHGIFIDDNDFVWLAGNGKKDGQLLKFTMDGKFVLQIGKQGQGNDSNSTERLGSPADVAVDVGGEGGLRRRRLRQPPRGRVRQRDRRLQAPLGCVWQQAERREDAAL